MLPTVDFCFKELMKNPKVRKGFVAAILGKEPETVRRTTVVETELRKESEDDKLGRSFGRNPRMTSWGYWMCWWNWKMESR